MEKLTWMRGDVGLEAHAYGRRYFMIYRTRLGWYLARYSQKMDGTIVFKSRESVRSQRDGKAYAENLWRLCRE